MKIAILLIIGTWLGLLIGLSFIEAPLKFQAPGMTVKLGLGIGQLIFGVLNKIEITFATGILLYIISSHYNARGLVVIISLLSIIVFIQAYILLPALDHRVDMILDGQQVPHSGHHLFYVIFEIAKLPLLVTLFIQLSKSQ